MRRRAAVLLLLVVGSTLAASGCLAEPQDSVRRDARGVRSVTWSVRETGRWSADAAAEVAVALGFDSERVGDVLLALDGEREMLRLTPRPGGLVVTMTRIDPRVVPPGHSVESVARGLREAYAPEADRTLAAFEAALAWSRDGDGSWSHATYRPSVADPLRPERRPLAVGEG